MGHAPTIVIGALILYVLHFRLGIGFLPTLLIGMAFAALSGYIGKRRSQK
jgi:hypothetical protein